MRRSSRWLTRREWLAAGGALMAARGDAQMGGGGGGGRMGGGGGMTGTTSPPTTAFVSPLPIPPALTPTVLTHPLLGEYDFYTVEARVAAKQLIPGLWTAVWGYNGLFPGPAIVARTGRPVVLRVVNYLPEGIVTHLHGGHVPVEHDGHALDYILPSSGGPANFRDYVYPNRQHAATLWYHDHALDKTGPHVWKGLAGPYVLKDDLEDSLPLPSGDYDVPLVLQDRLFNADGSLNYTLTQHAIRQGMHGDVMLVNGAIQPYFQVANRKYRFRILNGCNARLMQLALSTGQPFVQIGSDGGLLPAPVSRSSILISPGERVEVVVDFAPYKTNTKIVLRNMLGSGRTFDALRFDVVRKEADPSSVPPELRPIERLTAASRVRSFMLGMTMSGFTLNGLMYDSMRFDADPALNSTEIWEFVNPMGMWHCMHAHAIQWQVLDRDGAPPPPYEAGWKDTWYVPPGSAVRVIGRFDDYACKPDVASYRDNYMVHCHIVEHEDHGMMTQFKVMA